MKNFENVKEEIVRALKEEGITEPTTIQQKVIPSAQEGKDIIGISRTGSGKTAAFGIPLLEKIDPKGKNQCLVLAPTRELANQISGEMKKWGKYLHLTVATIFGGVAINPQEELLSRSQVIVGTPGRVLDLLNRGSMDLSNLHSFVLDEADKMVEMGFIEDIEMILSATPKGRQILLFGATISSEIDYLKNKYMNDTVLAEAELYVKKDLLKQYYYDVKMHEKFSLLTHLLKKEETGRVIIFCSKRTTVELVNRNLRDNGVKSEMIHGKMTQNKRLSVIERFNKGKTDYLVASAVAARGLDIKDVTHIFNYDLSQDPQEYVHRVGRTARAGESGKAITLLADQDHEAFHAIFNRYSLEVERLPLENFPKLRFNVQRFNDNRGGFRNNNFRGQRNSYGRNDRSNNRNSYGNNRGNNYSNNRSEDPADKYGLTERSSRQSY